MITVLQYIYIYTLMNPIIPDSKCFNISENISTLNPIFQPLRHVFRKPTVTRTWISDRARASMRFWVRSRTFALQIRNEGRKGENGRTWAMNIWILGL